jgi:predicted permease
MLSDLRIRMRSLFRRRLAERELQEELRFHLERQTEKYVAAGIAREEAARRARIELGGLEQTRERCRDARGTRLVENLAQDLRYGLRTLRKNPGYAAVAIVSLALGIGANAAIFSLMDAVLLSRLPVWHPEELVVVTTLDADSRSHDSFSYPMYRDLRDRNQAFDGVIARGGVQLNLSYRGMTEKVYGELVSGNYYDVLGVRPWIGRLLSQQDDRAPGAQPVAVLSYGFWQRRFGGDPVVVGQSVLLNEHPVTVIGVAAPAFYGTSLGANADVRLPLILTTLFRPMPWNHLEIRNHQWLDVMARRKPGVSVVQAQSSLDVLFHQILAGEEKQLPAGTSEYKRQRFLSRHIRLQPGQQGYTSLQREMRRPLLLMFAVTGMVLLILCANLANLAMARAGVRRQEAAVRLALGAGRARLLRQWLTESVMVSLGGALASVLVAWWGKAALVSFVPAESQANLESPLGWRVFGFMLVVGVAAGILTGLAPALRAARGAPGDALRSDSRTFAAGGGPRTLLGGLIVLQMALSLPLLVGAGSFVESLRNLEGMDTGFHKENILLASMNPSLNGYAQEKIQALYARELEEVRALPGVRSAGLSTTTPIEGGWDMLSVVVEGYQPLEGEDMNPNWTAISPGYLQSVGIALLAGRDFTDQDNLGAPKVAIINETMAHYFFKDANPLGRKIGLEKVPDTEIVGVVRDSKYVSLREAPRRQMYMPAAQQDHLFDLTLVARTAGDPRAVVDMVRAATARVDAHLPLYHVTTLEAQLDDSLIQDRLVAWLSALFGVLATLLSALGLYGVVTYTVQTRTREIGVRMALGAPPGQILNLFLRRTGFLLAFGMALGLGAALAVSGLIASMLFGVRSIELVIYVAAILLLLAAAVLAAYLPARRATRVDPVVALRHE